MPRTGPFRHRPGPVTCGLADVSGFRWPRFLGQDQRNAVCLTGAMADKRSAMMAGGVGDEGHGTARGPPAPPAGAGPMWGIGPGLSDHISCNDRDVLRCYNFVARASAGPPREFPTTGDGRRSRRRDGGRCQPAPGRAARERSARRSSRSTPDGCPAWPPGTASARVRGENEVERCSHSTAALPEQDTSRPSSS